MKCPDLTSRELQKYVGEKASEIIPNLVRLGLKIQSKEHFEGKATEAEFIKENENKTLQHQNI